MWKILLKKISSVFGTIKEHRLTTIAGAWVFYFLLAIIPLSFLLITAFNFFNIDLTGIVEMPIVEFRDFATVLLETAQNVSKTVTALFILTVIISASGLISQMSKDGDFIYGIKRKRKSSTIRRLFSIIALGILFLAFLTASLIFAFISKLFSFAPVKEGKNYYIIVIFILAILFLYVIIILLNKFIAPKKINFSVILLGSIISLFICVLGTIFFIIYLKFFSTYNAFYGSLAGIMVFILWAYILMFGVATGPLACKTIYAKKSEENYVKGFGDIRNKKSYKGVRQ